MSFKDKLKEPFQYEKIDLNEAEQVDEHSKPKVRDWKGTVKRIWKYLLSENWLLLFVIVMVVFSSAFSLLGPYMIGMGVDDYIVERQEEGIGTLIVTLLFIYLGYSLAIFLQNFFMIGIAQNTVYRLRSQLFNKLHELPINFFDKRQFGEIMSRVTNDVDNISNTLNQSVIQIFQSILTLVGTVAVMLYLSPLLTVVTLTIVPLMVFGMKWITKRTGPLFKIQQRRIGEMNGYVEETISGQRIVKTFSQENRVSREFEQRNDDVMRASYWAAVFSGFIPKLMNMLNSFGFAIIAFVGSIFAINGMVTVGTIVIFTELARQFTRPLNELSNQFNQLLTAVAGAERVFDIIDEDSEELDEVDAIEIGEPKGDVEFQNVVFAYDEDEVVLNDVSFNATAGSTVAFVGHTGAGKTTIINLMSRFYNYDDGQILLDGTDIKDIRRSSLRKHMGFVLQDAFLFEGTIRENIRYGKLDATDDEVVEAAKKANAHSFIMKFPNQYDTVLDPDGSGISQGQKQLLTIARVILSDPKILILDEATSSIDTVTEIKIQEALHRLMEGRTSFVIAHRLNTIQNADQIIMLEHGKIIEKGSHQELVKHGGKYSDLYQTQLKQKA
ncbi:ABC transporter ATP-binding protein [Alkalibacillus haloalkaliphilus]|uniref:Putative ABC transporter ATP-binding protein YfiC n=1 Tax=Alkalibacillus haloalkaliphilus TaxID=94136 RepID=A0A511W7P8_9BACI|nr:ABC transporter ATP-binding protein [Alkalibacillus haloalkaliphilus]GEN46083.1 putative ABC transporter ATP-binding protein YfiC [Alkalibacillus haloalkaliphilus]